MPPDGPRRPRRFPGPSVNPFPMSHDAHQFPSEYIAEAKNAQWDLDITFPSYEQALYNFYTEVKITDNYACLLGRC